MTSRKLSKSEMAYSTTKRELLAIVYMFTKFRKWLFGIPFILHTDHRSLIWLKTQVTPNAMLLQWYETIFFDFAYDIVHIPGSRNILLDALSRLFADDAPSSPLHQLEGGHSHNLFNNKSIFVKEKKRNHNALGSMKDIPKPTSSDLPSTTTSNALKPKKQKHLLKKQLKKNNFKYSSFPAKTDPNYYSQIDNEVDIFDAATYTNIPTTNARDLTSIKTNVSADSTASSYDVNILIARAMQYADYMTPPPSERIELIMKVHLLVGHVGINSIEKILHHDYKVHWSRMRDDIAKV